MFTYLWKDLKVNLNAKNVILDFEIASLQGLQEVYPDVIGHGCNFHLGQIIWRKIQALGFVIQYKQNSLFRLHVKMILVLSFVPVNQVDVEINKLEMFFIENFYKEECILVKWFKINFVVSDLVNKKLEFWNVYERTIENMPRTTNSIEGLHRHYNFLISTKQSNFVKILEELKIEQANAENYFIEYLYLKEKNEKIDFIKQVVINFANYYDLDYLKAIALNFNWKLD